MAINHWLTRDTNLARTKKTEISLGVMEVLSSFQTQSQFDAGKIPEFEFVQNLEFELMSICNG